MSQPATTVRAVYAAINRGEFDAIGELVEPQFEWHPNIGEPDSRVRRDSDDAMARVRDFVSAFGDFRTEVEELVDLGDRVAVAVLHRGTLAGTAGHVERREAHLWSFEGDRAVSLHEYPDLGAALEAASGPRAG